MPSNVAAWVPHQEHEPEKQSIAPKRWQKPLSEKEVAVVPSKERQNRKERNGSSQELPETLEGNFEESLGSYLNKRELL